MMGVPESTWTLLHLEDDAERARTIATAIAAMEFDVRLVDARSGTEVDQGLSVGDVANVGRDSAFRVEVRAADWDDLTDVLGEIIDEQTEFDALLLRRARNARRANWIILSVAMAGAAIAFLVVRSRL